MNEEKKIIAAEIDLDFITAQAGEWQAFLLVCPVWCQWWLIIRCIDTKTMPILSLPATVLGVRFFFP